MLSAPASIPCTSDITFRPGNAAPGTRYPSHTDSFTNSSIQQPSVADEALLVELHPDRIQARRPRRNVRTVMHHMVTS